MISSKGFRPSSAIPRDRSDDTGSYGRADTISYAYNLRDELISDGTTTLARDGLGRATSTATIDDNTWSRTKYDDDGHDHHRRKTPTTTFVFDGQRVIQTRGADAATFVRADDQGLLSPTTPGWKPETEVLLTDLVGSVLGVADARGRSGRTSLAQRARQGLVTGACTLAGGLRSFAGTTPVLMGDGSLKAIRDIKVGDKVLATDPLTGDQQPKPVTHLWVHTDDLTDLAVDGEVITTTEDHPFWSVTDRRWEHADQLTPGERVLAADGRRISVDGLCSGSARPGRAPVGPTTSPWPTPTPTTSAPPPSSYTTPTPISRLAKRAFRWFRREPTIG
jgi:hypothetical protein